jgi:hypothetical protein
MNFPGRMKLAPRKKNKINRCSLFYTRVIYILWFRLFVAFSRSTILLQSFRNAFLVARVQLKS